MINDQQRFQRRSFTLVELLVSISIITLLASMILVALAGVQETAKADRTRALIARIDTLVSDRWESFPRRRVAMRGVRNQVAAAKRRTDTLRELMRMELPDRKTDLLFGSVSPGLGPNGPWRAYRRRAAKQLGIDLTSVTDDAQLTAQLDSRWTAQYQGAECLYLILSQTVDQEVSALEFFRENEVGDIDGDRMPELLDGWGRPIRFLRWAPGFRLAGGPQDPFASEADPLDPLGIYANAAILSATADTSDRAGRAVVDAPYANAGTFALYPLIFSSGSDGQHDIVMGIGTSGDIRYVETQPPNNPYIGMPPYTVYGGTTVSAMLGTKIDANTDGDGSVDNITNHGLIASQ